MARGVRENLDTLIERGLIQLHERVPATDTTLRLARMCRLLSTWTPMSAADVSEDEDPILRLSRASALCLALWCQSDPAGTGGPLSPAQIASITEVSPPVLDPVNTPIDIKRLATEYLALLSTYSAPDVDYEQIRHRARHLSHEATTEALRREAWRPETPREVRQAREIAFSAMLLASSQGPEDAAMGSAGRALLPGHLDC